MFNNSTQKSSVQSSLNPPRMKPLPQTSNKIPQMSVPPLKSPSQSNRETSYKIPETSFEIPPQISIPTQYQSKSRSSYQPPPKSYQPMLPPKSYQPMLPPKSYQPMLPPKSYRPPEILPPKMSLPPEILSPEILPPMSYEPPQMSLPPPKKALGLNDHLIDFILFKSIFQSVIDYMQNIEDVRIFIENNEELNNVRNAISKYARYPGSMMDRFLNVYKGIIGYLILGTIIGRIIYNLNQDPNKKGIIIKDIITNINNKDYKYALKIQDFLDGMKGTNIMNIIIDNKNKFTTDLDLNFFNIKINDEFLLLNNTITTIIQNNMLSSREYIHNVVKTNIMYIYKIFEMPSNINDIPIDTDIYYNIKADVYGNELFGELEILFTAGFKIGYKLPEMIDLNKGFIEIDNMLFNYLDNIVLPNITEKVDSLYRYYYNNNLINNKLRSSQVNPPLQQPEYIDPPLQQPELPPVFNIHFENLPQSLTSFDLYCEKNNGQLNCKMK